MKILLILSSIIIVIIIIFLALKRTKKIRKKNTELLNFIFTIIATFFGVFLAIYMNNYSIQEQNINTTIKLLDASINEIELVKDEAEIQKDFILNATVLKQKLAENKFPYPSIFPRIMKNDMILKNISSNSLRALNNGWRNQIVLIGSISNTQEIMTSSDENLKNKIEFYISSLVFSKEVMEYEKEYLKGDISKKKLSENIKDSYEKMNK